MHTLEGQGGAGAREGRGYRPGHVGAKQATLSLWPPPGLRAGRWTPFTNSPWNPSVPLQGARVSVKSATWDLDSVF